MKTIISVRVADAITAEIKSLQIAFGDLTAQEFEHNVNHVIGLLTRYQNHGIKVGGNRRLVQVNRQLGLIYSVNSEELKISKVLFYRANI